MSEDKAFDFSADDMICEYLKNAEVRDKRNHIQNEQAARNIIKRVNEGGQSAPAVKTSDEELARLEQDIARGYVLR